MARALNQRGRRTRDGNLWSKNRIGLILGEEALIGSVVWGRRNRRCLRPKSEWLSLAIPPIVDASSWSLVQWLRAEREPRRSPGRAPASPKLLKGVLWCGACGASYQYETSGKRYSDEFYAYEYYNCRNRLRIGKEACAGFRIALPTLDDAIIDELTRAVCTEERARVIAERHSWPVAGVLEAWRTIIRRPEVARVYVRLLIARIEVHQRSIVVTPNPVGETMPRRFWPSSSLENEENRGPCRHRGFSYYRQTLLPIRSAAPTSFEFAAESRNSVKPDRERCAVRNLVSRRPSGTPHRDIEVDDGPHLHSTYTAKTVARTRRHVAELGEGHAVGES